jgi:hypothetical protein
MRRLLFLPLLAAFLVPAALAEDPAALPAPERAVQVQRNYGLIQTLVESGLHLAAEEDPLKRAHQCLDVAGRMAAEIRQAAEKREELRVVELGEHLHALLEQGVAGNIGLARRQIPSGSTAEKGLREACDQAAVLVRQLEEFLQSTSEPLDSAEMKLMLRGLHAGLDAVEKAFTGQTRSHRSGGPK